MDRSLEGKSFPLVAVFGIYTAAFLAVASPWLLGFVQVPWDSVSTFYPQFAFLARSFATGQSPFWPPNIVLLCAFLILPVRRWLICTLATFPAHLAAEMEVGMGTQQLLLAFDPDLVKQQMARVALTLLGG